MLSPALVFGGNEYSLHTLEAQEFHRYGRIPRLWNGTERQRSFRASARLEALWGLWVRPGLGSRLGVGGVGWVGGGGGMGL